LVARHLDCWLYGSARLSSDAFIRRFLIHVLPSGFHRIRHAGGLANGARRARTKAIRMVLGATTNGVTVWNWPNPTSTATVRHSAIGYVTPKEAEEAFYANLNSLDKVA
tara:strand:+ start:281 stop:607 length:327 start_codon:yes stop_codon:yes gene_type:complete